MSYQYSEIRICHFINNKGIIEKLKVQIGIHTQHVNIIHKTFALQAQSLLKAKLLSQQELKRLTTN
jgi:hypothetical protein